MVLTSVLSIPALIPGPVEGPPSFASTEIHPGRWKYVTEGPSCKVLPPLNSKGLDISQSAFITLQREKSGSKLLTFSLAEKAAQRYAALPLSEPNPATQSREKCQKWLHTQGTTVQLCVTALPPHLEPTACQKRCHLCHLWQSWWHHYYEGTWSPSVNSGTFCDPSHWDGAATLDLLTMFRSWWASPGKALLQHFCTMSDRRPLPQLSQCYMEANSSAWQAADFQLEI